MIPRTLVRRNLIHFWQVNLAVVVGVAVAVAVLAGALLVGVSVRTSLRSLALQRLGAVEQVITTGNFVREIFADALLVEQDYEIFYSAAPLIAVEGFVTHQESGRRASAVQVYGVDDRFWRFHQNGREGSELSRNRVLISSGLARELGADLAQALIVRVQVPSQVPISSLHGRREDVGRSMRLEIAEVLGPDELGEFSFRPQQGLARSVFVSLARLQEELEQEGRVNTVLLSQRGNNSQAVWALPIGDEVASTEAAVRAVASLDDLGLRVRQLPDRSAVVVEAAAGVLSEATVDAVVAAADELGFSAQPVMTYLANKLRLGDLITPYSLVTALDLSVFSDEGDSGRSREDALPAVVLNTWAADDLDAEVGDTIEMEYHVWEDEGRLATETTSLRVRSVIPIEGIADDQDFAPDYPGITEANDLIEWDPPFEIDLGLIRQKDEDYWDVHRTTPKAFISLEDGQRLWETRWGRLTSVRLFPDQQNLDVAAESVRVALSSRLDPLASSFVVYPARALALEASAGVTDFGLYFIYFSFFLVVSALLLASLFFRLGVEQRLREIGVLRATGFSPIEVRRVFWAEALVLSSVGSALGVFGAIVYGEFIMWGLRTWWVDAVGTTRLSFYISTLPLVAGAAAGVSAGFISIALALRSVTPASPRSLLSGALSEVGHGDVSRARKNAVVLGLTLVVIGFAAVALTSLDALSATTGFFTGGLLILCAMLLFMWVWLTARPRRHTNGPWSVTQVGFRNATYRAGRSVLCVALIAFAAFIIVAVDAFRRDGSEGSEDRNSGTGGYRLLADVLLPIAHDPSSESGRDFLNLIDLYEAGGVLENVQFSRFRVRPGEDASCLNLYQAKDPRILAPTHAFVAEARFAFSETIDATPEEAENPWLLLDRKFPDGAIPAIADATSLTYALHLAVGDDFVLNRDTDRPIHLRVVAALSDSIFQRELLISEDHFQNVFPDYDGYRFFLIDTTSNQVPIVSAALEDRLSDYGFDVVLADERLAAFHQVENTYLATFQTLGGLGLILGTVGLGAVLLRNVLERKRELALLRAVGYNAGHVTVMVVAENAFLLLTGVIVGTLCALVAIAPAWWERGGGIPVLSLVVLLMLVVVTGLTASLAATFVALRSPLLQALRTE